MLNHFSVSFSFVFRFDGDGDTDNGAYPDLFRSTTIMQATGLLCSLNSLSNFRQEASNRKAGLNNK